MRTLDSAVRPSVHSASVGANGHRDTVTEILRYLGDDIANELVTWFNSVDATYRADLRELNEVNFARFDAKMGERLAQLDAKWETRLTALDAKWEGRWTRLDAKVDLRAAEVSTKLAELKSDLVRWMFAFWVTAALALGGLYFRP